MNKDKINLFIILILYFLVLFLTYYYVKSIFLYKVQPGLTPELIDKLDKEELKLFLEEKKSIQNIKGLLLLIPISGISGLILGLIIQNLFKVKKSRDISKLFDLFPNYEREILKMIYEKGGEVEQYYIRYKLGLNKVKVKRLVDKLVSRNLVEVKRFGRINKITFSKKLSQIINGFK